MTIKDQINQKEGLKSTVYSLKFGTTVLDDNKSIFSYKIKAGSTVFVDYTVITITVDVLDENKTLSVDPDDKVSTIRTKLVAQGVQNEGYSLVVGGTKLVETLTIAKAGIKSGTIVVVDYADISINYKIQGRTQNISVDPDNKVQTIRDAIKEKENISIDGFDLKVSNQVLNSNITIYEAGIRAGSIIEVDYRGISINVQVPSGQVITIFVDPDATVSTIKNRISVETHIQITRFTITIDGRALVDTQTIYEAGIRAGSTIKVDMSNFNVNVKLPSGQIFKVSVDPDSKISTIKDQVMAQHSIL